MFDKAKLKSILTSEYNYKPYEADVYLRDFPPIHEELSLPFERWLIDRVVIDVAIEDISILDVMRIRQIHFLGAIRELNRLLDSNMTTKQREILKKDLRVPPEIW